MNDNQKLPFGQYKTKHDAKEAAKAMSFPCKVVHIKKGCYALKRT